MAIQFIYLSLNPAGICLDFLRRNGLMLCWNLLQVAVPFPVSGPDPEYALKVGDIVKVYSSATSDGHRGYSGKAKLIEKLGDIPDFWMVRFDDGGAYFNTFVYLSEQGGS